jgi:hypothetical protein
VYFQVTEKPLSNESIYWSMDDESGTTLFDTCLQCGDPGFVTLERGGVYTMYIGGGDGTGPFAITTWIVPPFSIFEIKIGDLITPKAPGEGTGIIEVPGAHDIYTFTARAGQTVVFSAEELSANGDSIQWRLEDEDENEFFNTCLDCSAPEPVTFESDGTYRLIVGSETTAGFGEYQFSLVEVK